MKQAIARLALVGRRRIAATLSLIAVAAAVLSVQPLVADEPMVRFVEALRKQDDFELAIEYLDSLANQDTLSAANRDLLPFVKAQTLSQQATRSRDLRKAEWLLMRAQEAIQQYRPADANELSQAQTAQFRGDLLFNQARVATTRTQDDRNSEAEREQFNQQTRTLLNESAQQYEAATASLREALKSTRIDPEDDSTIAQIKRLRAQFTYLRTRGPAIGELIADTFPNESPERMQRLTETAQQAAEIWEKYSRYSAALDACLVAARCHQKLGQHDASLTRLNDILSLVGGPALLPFKRQALAIAVDSWQQTSPYPWEAVVRAAQPIVRKLPPDTAAHPQWQTIQLTLAQALHLNAAEVSQQKGTPAKRRANELTEAAIAMAQAVAQSPGGRPRANELLKSWNVDGVSGVDTDGSGPAADGQNAPLDFASASQQSKSIAREVHALQRELAAASKKSPDQRDAIRQRLNERATATLAAIDHAITIGRDANERDALNNLRYLECFCHFAMDHHWEAAVIGEFLLEKRTRVAGSRQAAAIAMQSYAAINASQAVDAKLASRRLIEIGNALIQRFPGSAESASAAAQLAQRSLRESDWQAAESYFAEIPSGSRAHAAVAANLGRQAWLAWSKNNASVTDPQRGDQQFATAKRYFTEAVNSSDEVELTYAIAEAALLLAEIHLTEGNLSAAIERLESAPIAPLALVANSHPALVRAGRLARYQQDTAMTAVKTYMAALQESPGDPQWIEKTRNAIDGLQQTSNATKTDAAAAKRLTAVYRSISRRLIEQFEALPAGEPQIAFGGTLADFLGAFGKRSTDSSSVVWAGATLLSIANTLNQADARAVAKPIFDQAILALDRAESLGMGSGEQAIALTRELKRQRALAELGAGNFDDAVEQFGALLTERAGDLTTQMDAALALQLRGRATGQATDFAKAITGTAPVVDPKTNRRRNAIWGWRKLVQATRGNKQFVDAFHQCLYHMIECRYELAKANDSPDGMRKALAELNNWQQRTADFGGTQWQGKFADLKKRIQTP